MWRNNTVWVRTTNAVPDDIVIKFFHTDALGSVRAVTDMAGQPTARYDYGAFGEGPGVSAATEKQRFAGTERDAETFLDYMGARYYRNVNGRFNSPDPRHANANITRPQSWNAYAYASNNPLRFVDPTGLSDSPIGGGDKDFGRDLIVADSPIHEFVLALPQLEMTAKTQVDDDPLVRWAARTHDALMRCLPSR